MADGSAQLPLPLAQELVVDLFAGGGGASLGISRGYREPDVAVNHNPIAIAVHEANHPGTTHYTCDVFEVDPLEATGGQPVAVLWASPDCRHHSKAKGGKPRSKRVRGLAWVVVKWAAACRPRIIHLENVEEFADWGPLTADGRPCPDRKGMTFRRWVRQLENLGYVVEHRELVASDYGTPTIRKRLYVTARRDGRPIVWPKPTHSRSSAGGLPKWRAASEIVDWSIEGRSIFGRRKPLAKNTERRIAKGLWRYTLTAAEPFIVKPNHTASWYDAFRGHAIDQPLQTVTQEPGFALCTPVLSPFLTECANASTQRVFDATEPLRTQVAQVKGGHFALVAGTLIQTGYGERPGQAPRALDMSAPLGTVVAGGVKHAVVSAHITKFRHNSVGSSIHEPVHTITAGGEMRRPAGAAHAMGLISAHLVTNTTGHAGGACSAPMKTITTGGQQALCTAFFDQANGGFYDGDGRPASAPLSTVCASGANQRLVAARWIPCASGAKPHADLVEISTVGFSASQIEGAQACAGLLREHLPEHIDPSVNVVLLEHGGTLYLLVDITLRMLTPRELARAQGFPDSYVIERGADGRAITKTDQVRLIGNSVCPDVAEALIRANAADLINLYGTAAA